jgi:micrococcal nuclease
MPHELKDHYIRRARVTRVIDGDTLDLMIDLGYEVWKSQRVRLALIDTPEVRGVEKEAGLAAKQFVVEWVSKAGPLFYVASKIKRSKDKYGRYVVKIYDVDGNCLNSILHTTGHAVLTEYD